MVDPEGSSSLASGERITRRQVLKKSLLGAAGLVLLPAVAAACQGSASPPAAPNATAAPATLPPATPTPTPSPTPPDFLGRKLSGALTVGSNHSAPTELAGMKAIDSAFAAATDLAPTLNTVNPGTFQDQMNAVLGIDGGSPNDAFTWFSGYRMRSLAAQGLAAPIDDVWAHVKDNFTAGLATTVTGNDGRVYGIPVDFYPWCMFYRKSVWAAKGYTVPATWDDLLALCARMQKDGLTPIAFGDHDGWPAMGIFDILDLRLNGYDFHIALLDGAIEWTDPRVTTVFETWRKLIPYCSPDFADLTWQGACDALVRETAGMYFIGLFLTDEVNAADPTGAALADIDFFPFPAMGNDFDAEAAIDAPVDVWMLYAKSPTLAADLDNARAYLEFWARGSTQLLMYKADRALIPTARDADPAGFDALTAKAVSIVGNAGRIAQFMDRDSRPEFVGANGMQSFLLDFLKNPNQDLPKLEASIQDFWDSLPPYRI